MPRNFVRAQRAIERGIRSGDIPKYYYKRGKRFKTSSYALARYATGFYGPTHRRKVGARVHRVKRRSLY
jgi:hypothetical protein